MAAVQIQKKEYFSTTDATGHSIVLDSTPTENNVIIVFVTSGASITVGPSGYTQATSGNDFVRGHCYYKIAGASESATISITISVADAVCLQAFEYSGLLNADLLDQTSSVTDVGSGTTIVSGTTGTSEQANELVFVSAHMRTSEVPAQSVTAWTNSFTIENECVSTGAANSNVLLNVASKIVSAVGTFQSTGTITTGGLGNDVALVASFKIASDPPVATISWFTA